MMRNISKIHSVIIISMIRAYQIVISPYLGSHCRFYPSCSRYAIMSIQKYGTIKGTLKALFRILRCNPFSPGGIDYP